jgi:hypothetical protein
VARLAKAGYSVLLLEAGFATQSALLPMQPDPAARKSQAKTCQKAGVNAFDVPLEWLEIGQNPAFGPYHWKTKGTHKVTTTRFLVLEPK